MDGRASLKDGELVVNLKGVPAAMAYGWGMEAGVFMTQVRDGTAIGIQVFAAGNIGMIEMICTENHLDLDVLSSEDEYVLVKVTKHRLRVVRG